MFTFNEKQKQFRQSVLNVFKDGVNQILSGDIISAPQIAMDAATQATKLGFENIVQLFEKRPLPFSMFIEHIGAYFDEKIQSTEKNEALNYVGGTFSMELSSDDCVSLAAELYYRDPDGKWVQQSCAGSIDGERFTDWETAPELIKLMEDGKLALPIEAPETA